MPSRTELSAGDDPLHPHAGDDPLHPHAGDGQATVRAVLLAAELVPEGRVVSYGDLAALVGTSARRVGRIMARHGHETHWWRVTNHNGDLVVLADALPHWSREGITVKPNGKGCRMSEYRADLAALADAWDRASRTSLPDRHT